MSTEALEQAEDLLRHAVTYRHLHEVDSRVLAYCSEADEQLRLLPEQDSRHRALLTRVLDMLEWTRLMLYAARAACAAKMERVATIDRYLGTQTAEPRPATHFDL
jgi:hypothetical protein